MANDEHVALLKQGVAVWNAWRSENHDKPDLSGADLGFLTLCNMLVVRAPANAPHRLAKGDDQK